LVGPFQNFFEEIVTHIF